MHWLAITLLSSTRPLKNPRLTGHSLTIHSVLHPFTLATEPLYKRLGANHCFMQWEHPFCLHLLQDWAASWAASGVNSLVASGPARGTGTTGKGAAGTSGKGTAMSFMDWMNLLTLAASSLRLTGWMCSGSPRCWRSDSSMNWMHQCAHHAQGALFCGLGVPCH